MAEFSFKNAEDIRDTFARHGVRYLFFGKSGAILLGYSDTTQDVDLFVDKNSLNCSKVVEALKDLGFALTEQQVEEIRIGKDFIQLRNGPFDLDLIFAPDGIERFDDAWKRYIDCNGFPVCNLDDILASKKAANRQKDKESLPRLISFRDWLKSKGKMR